MATLPNRVAALAVLPQAPLPSERSTGSMK